MSEKSIPDLVSLSDAFSNLVEASGSGVLAIKAAPYRTVSGIALGDDLIAVADHTLRREDRVPIQNREGKETTGTIVGRDPSVDLAIVKAEGVGARAWEAANEASFKAGSLALVVGMTADVGASVSLGIIAATGPGRRTWRGGMLDQFIRLDVNLYPSQSGAAVISAHGKLIGMATGGLSRHSIFAVPVATMRRVADEIVREGRIRHGYLGIGSQAVAVPRSLREKLGNAVLEAGVLIFNVEPDSPAEKAGMQVGDILIALDGKPINNVEDLQNALRGGIVGRTVTASVIRGGEPLSLQVGVTERQKSER
jgi:S1-C subfamily serine protease